ncbi:MAG: DUF885 family protein [Maricaulaceae bacterium]
MGWRRRLAGLAALLAAAATSAHAQADAELQTLIADFESFELERDVIRSGREGDLDALSRLPDVRPETIAAQLDQAQAFLKRAMAIPTRDLDAEDQLNRDLLIWVLENRLARGAFDEARMPFVNDSGFHAQLLQLSSQTWPRDLRDAEAWLNRLLDAPRFFDQNVANMRRGLEGGWTQPVDVVGRVIDQLGVFADEAGADSPLLNPIRNLGPQVSPEQKADLLARGEAIIDHTVQPAFQSLLDFFETEYLPRARPTPGVGGMPEGLAWYETLARFHTTTEMSPRAIHKLGLREVERIRARMDAVIEETGFEGSFKEFLTFLRTDEQFYAKSEKELLREWAWISKTIDGKMPAYFRTLPRLSYGVRDVPAALAPAYTTGRYWPGDPEAGRAGFSVVNTYDLRARPLYELKSLALHEGVPGHHHQFALAQEIDGVPKFRKRTYITAYGEGWGLYTEFLGEEMGMYETPYELFGRLSYEMWRACRLVVDTGLHALGWTRAQAEACFLENSALSKANITTEVDRYIAWPGQALAYKIGELTIKRLRSEAEEALGERFDVRDFHDAVLLRGAVPLELLEARIEAWVDSQTDGQG